MKSGVQKVPHIKRKQNFLPINSHLLLHIYLVMSFSRTVLLLWGMDNFLRSCVVLLSIFPNHLRREHRILCSPVAHSLAFGLLPEVLGLF